MRTITKEIYTFEELSEQAKEKAREWYRQGNLDYDWWDSIYDEAEELGFKITEFDLGRANYCKIKAIETPKAIALNILEQHGRDCKTWKTARDFMWSRHYRKQQRKLGRYLDHETESEEFLHSLSEDYRIMLRNEWEWLNSDECVDENIIANEYEFDEEGRVQ